MRAFGYWISKQRIEVINNVRWGYSFTYSYCFDGIDKYGQGYNLYLPLMGTGMSRINLSYQDSLDLITSTLLENKNLIHGKISIVIQPNVIDTINLEV